MASLTPKGLPYGENQAAAGRQRQAGLPMSVGAAASSQPAAAAAPPAPSPIRPGSSHHSTADPLLALNPAAPVAMAPSPSQQFQLIAERSTNPLIRLIALRLADDNPR
jgi:hypothetical protein